MARMYRQPSKPGPIGRPSYKNADERNRRAASDPTLLSREDIVVHVVSFKFRFGSIEQLRDCLEYFRKKTHPSSRISAKKLAAEFGEGWREVRGWEIERWYERLPLYLFEEPKRVKIVRALEKALKLAEEGRLKSA